MTASLQAQVFREVSTRLPYPLALQLVADEEVGGRDGTLYQLQQRVTGTIPQITEYLQTFCEPDVTVAADEVNSPHHGDHDRPEIKELRRAAQGQSYPADLLYKHGSGDGVLFRKPSHGLDEYVEIGTIVPYYRALKEFLERLGPVGQPSRVTSTVTPKCSAAGPE